MSSYHTSFTYNGLSSIEKGVVLAAFDADSGKSDAFLGMDVIFSDTNSGVRHDYGAKHNSVATITMQLLHFNGTNFSVANFRDITRWLTGARKSSWLDLYEDDRLVYSFLCKCTDVQQYKMDGLTLGVIVTFTATSPWAYSAIQEEVLQLNGEQLFPLYNESDNLYDYTYLDVIYKNGTGSSLSIYNDSTKETMKVEGLEENEIVLINSNKIIYSNKANKIFGDSFNYVWPRLYPGANDLTISGNGELFITYRYAIKAGDCVMDIDLERNMNSGICEEMSKAIASNEDVIRRITNAYNDIFTNSLVDYTISKVNDTKYRVGNFTFGERDMSADTTTERMFLDSYNEVFGGDK